jgi:hypothetical protein
MLNEVKTNKRYSTIMELFKYLLDLLLFIFNVSNSYIIKTQEFIYGDIVKNSLIMSGLHQITADDINEIIDEDQRELLKNLRLH